MTQVWPVAASAAAVVALVLAGIAGAACWWGCAQRRTTKRWEAYSDGLAVANEAVTVDRDALLQQVETAVAWLTADMDKIGEDR